MIQGVDDVGDVFAQIAVDVPFAGQQFRRLIDQVGRQHPVDCAVGVGFVETVQARCEKTKSRKYKNSVGTTLFQCGGNFQHTLAGGDHIVYDDHILTLYAGAEELVCDDGVSAVDDARVISALIEHTHIQSEYIGDVDGAAHAALVGADHHHVAAVQLQAFYVVQQTLDKLVGGLYRLEAMQRDRVLYAGIVGVEGDDIVHAHIYHLLEGQRTVERFSCRSLVLSALIEIGHDDGDSSRLAAHRGDDAF